MINCLRESTRTARRSRRSGISPTTSAPSASRGRYGWTGREYDAEIELQYNRARYYDATTGRWISQDPLRFDAGDSNLYRYSRNQATLARDPSGMQPAGYLSTGLGSVKGYKYVFGGKTYKLDVKYAKFSPAGVTILVDRLGRLRAALDQIQSDIGQPAYNPLYLLFQAKGDYTEWSSLSKVTQNRVSHWFGNGKRLDDYQFNIVRSVFSDVVNGFDGKTYSGLRFQNDPTLKYEAWSSPVGAFYIRLGPTWWARNPHRQSGVILHELTHVWPTAKVLLH